MKEFQQKHSIRKKVYSKPVIIVLLIVFVLSAKGVINIYKKESESRVEVERLTKHKNEIEERLAKVSISAEVLRTREGIETEIRNKFDVVKEGEQVIVVVDKELPPPPEEKKNFLEKFWGGVTGVFKKGDKKTTAPKDQPSSSTTTQGEGDW